MLRPPPLNSQTPTTSSPLPSPIDPHPPLPHNTAMRKLLFTLLALSSLACDRTINEVRAPQPPQSQLASTHP